MVRPGLTAISLWLDSNNLLLAARLHVEFALVGVDVVIRTADGRVKLHTLLWTDALWTFHAHLTDGAKLAREGFATICWEENRIETHIKTIPLLKGKWSVKKRKQVQKNDTAVGISEIMDVFEKHLLQRPSNSTWMSFCCSHADCFRRHAFPYVFLSVPHTGESSLVHIISHEQVGLPLTSTHMAP